MENEKQWWLLTKRSPPNLKFSSVINTIYLFIQKKKNNTIINDVIIKKNKRNNRIITKKNLECDQCELDTW